MTPIPVEGGHGGWNQRLIYAHDPLCGWCYGFIPALAAVQARWPGLPVDLRMGGLVTGGRIGPYAAMADYIRGASARMEAVTGQRLGQAFHDRILGGHGAISSSIPACDAILQVRTRHPDRAVAYAAALQTAHFRDGQDLNDPATHARVAAAVGVEAPKDLPRPDELRAPLAAEFDATAALGLRSYPTLLVADGTGLHPVAIDYAPAGMVARLAAAMAGIAA